ncbi:Elongation factor 4 [Quillaja saponaria]|uniref:Elongation factor 4 n=1 Tax=Quillaja saponaria TaxID=32244 RepID=A0AAD7LYE2_QUISA|nr:Elongation factor 4 [Quillaja saponaria]
MELWDKMIFPMRRVWTGVAKSLGIRKSGMPKLRRDVRACEYEDIHIMWEMLKKNETEHAQSPGKSKKFPRKNNKRHCWNMIEWARCTPFMCRTF